MSERCVREPCPEALAPGAYCRRHVDQFLHAAQVEILDEAIRLIEDDELVRPVEDYRQMLVAYLEERRLQTAECVGFGCGLLIRLSEEEERSPP